MDSKVSVLQLDTQFPRVPGDVASADSYTGELEIIRIPNASVSKIVTHLPHQIDITPFEKAIESASGDVIVTSCGFLSFWQNHLEKLTQKPFISSALTAFKTLSEQFAPEEVLTLTFDDESLTPEHFGSYSAYATNSIGLPHSMHLRRVISENRKSLDVNLAQQELIEFISSKRRPHHKHMVLECTNLPPYAKALRDATGLGITHILSCVDKQLPGSVQTKFLS